MGDAMTRTELAFAALSVATASLIAVGLSSRRPEHVPYNHIPVIPPTRPQARVLTADDFDGLVGLSQSEVIGRIGAPGKTSRWDFGWQWEYTTTDGKAAAVRFRSGLGSVESVTLGGQLK